MTEARCACGQPSPDAVICWDCTCVLEEALQAIPALAADLDIAIARLAVFGDRTHARSHTAVLPFDERAANAYADLAMKLFGWAAVLAVMVPRGPGSHADAIAALPPYTDLPGTATWLLSRMSALRQHEAAGAIVNEITHAYDHARRVIDRPAQRVYAGPCDCRQGELMTQPGRTLVTCPACGTAYGVQERQEWMRNRLADLLVTAHEASVMLPGIGIHVTDGTIRVWASRRKLERRPSPTQDPRYRLGDIVVLALNRDAARTA